MMPTVSCDRWLADCATWIACRLARQSGEADWIVGIGTPAWQFVSRARGVVPVFDTVVHLQPWSEEHLAQWLTGQALAAGLDPSFEELVVWDGDGSAPPSDHVEEVLAAERSFFRMVWDYTDGNPGSALELWQRALLRRTDGQLLVRLPDLPDPSAIDGLPTSLHFVLRAIVQLDVAARKMSYRRPAFVMKRSLTPCDSSMRSAIWTATGSADPSPLCGTVRSL